MAERQAEDLDALIRRVDPDRWLSSRFIADPEKRTDVVALYAFDHELRRAVEGTTNPVMAEIRLTWWSEAVDEIYAGGAVRRHPTAEALAAAVRRRALPREVLEAAVDARLTPDRAAAGADAAGAIAEAVALVLDPDVDRLAARRAASPVSGRAADARLAAKALSAAAFPAVAHVALRGRARSELWRRLRVTWAVVRGRL